MMEITAQLLRYRGDFLKIVALSFTLFLTACVSNGLGPGESRSGARSGINPHKKVGKPYLIENRLYYPAVDKTYSELGVASWYGPKFHGRPTANGELFDMNAMTAAHRTLPLPSIVEVTNLNNNRTIRVRVNDRGPFAKDRIIDLSKAAAQELGFIQQGTARVKVVYLHEATLDLALVRLGDRRAMKKLTTDFYPRSTRKGRGQTSRGPSFNQNFGGGSAIAPITVSGGARAIGQSDNGQTGNDPLGDLIVRESQNHRGHTDQIRFPPSTSGEREEVRQRVIVRQQNPLPYNQRSEIGRYRVQVGAFSDLNRVEAVRQHLSQFAPLQVLPRNLPAGGVVYKVLVGPFVTRQEADVNLKILRQTGYGDAWILRDGLPKN